MEQMEHSEEFWQNLVHWRRKCQPTPVFLLQELHRQYEKATNMTSLPGHKISNVQLRMSLVVKVKSKVVKEQYYIGIWDVGSMNQGKLGVVK